MPRSSLSVIIPNYNDSACIGEAVEAICEQSLPPDEVIVIDDGSTDNSVEIIRKYVSRYPMLRLERNDVNRGVNYTVNRGLKMARSQFFLSCSANDRLLPGLIEKSMTLLADYPQAVMCFSNLMMIDKDSGQQFMAENRWLDRPGFVSAEDLAGKLDGGHVYGLSWIARRDLMLEMNGYLPELKWNSDWFLQHVIGFRYGSCYLPDPLVVWKNDRAGSYSSGQFNSALHRQVFVEVLKLLVSPAYKDVIPLMIRGRALNMFRSAMSVSAVLEAVKYADKLDEPVLKLVRHLAWEMTRNAANEYRQSLDKTCTSVRSGTNDALGVAKNRCDQVYARAVHEAHRIRQRLRGG